MPVAEGIVALVGVVGSQRLLAELRSRTRMGGTIDDRPVLLVGHGEVLIDRLRQTGMSEQDGLCATLRASGMGAIQHATTAVIFELTGEGSVLTGPISDFDPCMFERVDRAEHLRLLSN